MADAGIRPDPGDDDEHAGPYRVIAECPVCRHRWGVSDVIGTSDAQECPVCADDGREQAP